MRAGSEAMRSLLPLAVLASTLLAGGPARADDVLLGMHVGAGVRRPALVDGFDDVMRRTDNPPINHVLPDLTLGQQLVLPYDLRPSWDLHVAHYASGDLNLQMIDMMVRMGYRLLQEGPFAVELNHGFGFGSVSLAMHGASVLEGSGRPILAATPGRGPLDHHTFTDNAGRLGYAITFDAFGWMMVSGVAVEVGPGAGPGLYGRLHLDLNLPLVATDWGQKADAPRDIEDDGPTPPLGGVMLDLVVGYRFDGSGFE